MRIAIDLLIAEKEPGGMLFATHALLEGLARVDQQNEYIVITSQPKDYKELAKTPSIQIYPVRLRTWRGILIQHQLKVPDILKKIKPDILHVPAFAAPIGWHGPLVLTVHDLAFLTVPQQSSLYARLYWQYMLRESVKRAQQIIAISEQTREELFTYWSVDPSRVQVIHNALRPTFRLEQIAPAARAEMRQRWGGPYLLHVGRIMPRKNVEVLVQAFALLAERFTNLQLVLAGGAGYDSSGVLQQIASSPYRERIHQPGWVPEQDMGALYAEADMLVFPSKHEGFGLPTVEAMACGTPVIASLEAVSSEVGGSAVLRVDCSNAETLARAITQMLTEQPLRQQLIALGLKQAETFTSERNAYATIQVYQKALNPGEVVLPCSKTQTEGLPDDEEQKQTTATTGDRAEETC